MGIGETLHQALAKLVMRVAGDLTKTAGENLQLCVGLKAGIEGATHAVGQQRIEQVRARRRKEMAVDGASDEEEESGEIEATLNKLTIETAGTEEEVVEQLEDVLDMEVEEAGEEEEGGDEILRALRALELLTYNEELSRTTLVDARNGFNKLS